MKIASMKDFLIYQYFNQVFGNLKLLKYTIDFKREYFKLSVEHISGKSKFFYFIGRQ